MDPIACLLEAEEAINDYDVDIAYDCLANYAHWRSKGGLSPSMPDQRSGDEFYHYLRTRYDVRFAA